MAEQTITLRACDVCGSTKFVKPATSSLEVGDHEPVTYQGDLCRRHRKAAYRLVARAFGQQVGGLPTKSTDTETTR